MLRASDVSRLACPSCRGALAFSGALVADRLARGQLACAGCCGRFSVEEGLARLYREEEVRGKDRLLRRFYDGLPSLHDPAVRLTLPLFGAGREREIREGYRRRLDLPSLRPREDGQPARILDVGVGTGADLPLLRADLSPGVPGFPVGAVELWGLDLSAGMLGICRRRLREAGDRDTRLLLADAHALPFPDGAFDRVFHVGAMNSFRDPRRALAELARVARPGTPIVVVDEQLDRSRTHGLYHRAMFRLVTFYDENPRCPTELLPAGATDVIEEQLGRFFYCLTFRVGARAKMGA